MSASDEAHNREFLVNLGTMLDDVFVGCGAIALESIKDGSPLTGALGQPKDTGALYNSWLMEREGRNVIVIGTPLEYAEPVEDAVGPHGPVTYGEKNGIGGSHSVKTTVAAKDRIVAESMRRYGQTASSGPSEVPAR